MVYNLILINKTKQKFNEKGIDIGVLWHPMKTIENHCLPLFLSF